MYATPTAARRIREFLREEYQRAFRHDHWHVGFVDAPIHAFLDPEAKLEVQWFPMPQRGRYWADPFGVPRGGATEILLEEFRFRSSEGTIASARVESNGDVSLPEPVLEFPHHASYPYLVERDGAVYCIPETAEGREVSLYRAADFPRRWTKDATLLANVAGLDNTVIEWNGAFWLFHTDWDDGPFSKLRIWHAPELRGPWRPHAANPVKTDIASARPAGTPFVHDGELYRPAQDSSRGYGRSLVINRVLRLSPTEYQEERAVAVAPFRDGIHRHGIHTISAAGDRTLVDGKRYRFNGWAMARNLIGSRRAEA